MLYIGKYLSSAIENAKRMLSLLIWGSEGAYKASDVTPFGIDSQPIPNDNIEGIYAETSGRNNRLCLGFINKRSLAASGEFRCYSLGSGGDVVGYIWLRTNPSGHVMELGGTDNFAVKFTPLEEQFNEMKGTLNDLVNAFNSHTHATTTPGAPTNSPTPVPGIIPATPSTANISLCKNDKIKTI